MKTLKFNLLAILLIAILSACGGDGVGFNGTNDDDNGNNPQSDVKQSEQYIPGIWVSEDGLSVIQLNQPLGTTQLSSPLTYKYGTYTEYVLSSRNSNKYTHKFTGTYYSHAMDNNGKFSAGEIVFETALEGKSEKLRTLAIDELSKNNMHIYRRYSSDEEYSLSKGDESDIPSECDLERLLLCGRYWAVNFTSGNLFAFGENKDVCRCKLDDKIEGTYSLSGNTLICYYDCYYGKLNAFPEIDGIPQTAEYSIKYNKSFEIIIDGTAYWALTAGIYPITVDLEDR